MQSINFRALFFYSVTVLFSVSGCATGPASNSGFTIVTGSAAYRQRIAMSPDAVLNVRVEDVSRADAKSEVLAESKEIFGNRQVPLAYSLQVPNSAIEPNHDYNLRATISENGQLRFVTTRRYPILTRGNPAKIDVMLDAVQISKSTNIGPASNDWYQIKQWQGEFRYMADAAAFTDCVSGKRWPVAMTGDYLTAERDYLKKRSVPGAPLLVGFTGRLETRTATAGNTAEQIVIEKFSGSKANVSCESLAAGKSKDTANLKDTYWKLVELDGKAIPIAPSHKQQIRIILASAGSRVMGFSGCNQVAGTYTESGNQLRFFQLAGTMMACVSPYMELENQVLGMLNATNAYSIEGEQLYLKDGGRVLGRFESLYLR